MTALPVTSFFAALAALGLTVLSLLVVWRRFRQRIPFGGEQDDKLLRRRVRAHGNFIEYVPLGLIVLALIEYQGAGKWMVWTLGGMLAVGRLFHATALIGNIIPLRSIGVTLTLLMLAASGVILLQRLL